MSDRSLDEFATGDGAEKRRAEDAADDADETTADDDSDVETPASPTTTMRWSPNGAACDTCGEAVDRRWRDADDFVCADCKEW